MMMMMILLLVMLLMLYLILLLLIYCLLLFLILFVLILGVQAVGIDTSEGYWKIRNSWGTDWGESGFIRLAYGRDLCWLTYDPTYTSVILF